MLVSISGVSIHRMTCLSSGNSIVAIGAQSDPCCDRQPINSISENCCENSVVALQLEEFNRTVDDVLDVVPAVIQTKAPLQFPNTVAKQPTAYRAKAPPQPHCGNLALFGVFRL